MYDTQKGDSPLEHHGVKGMHWGQRKQLRALDRASRKKDREARNAAIDAARARVASGDLGREYSAAKANYKSQKRVIGRREASKILRAKREKLNSEYELSKEAKSGAETAAALLATAGGVVLTTAILSRRARR